MNEKKMTGTSQRRRAEETFSIAPIQDQIDERLSAPVHDTFSERELKRLGDLAKQALQKVDGDDVYGAEVFVPMHDEGFIYDMEADPPLRVTMENATLYGYAKGFVVDVLPHDNRMALSMAFEEISSDPMDITHSYLVPMAIEESRHGVRVFDAPSPVGESDVEVVTTRMYDLDVQDVEQDTMHSLLNIVENDLFDEVNLGTDVLESSVESMKDAGFIERTDDIVTACNYYLQKSLHDQDPWFVRPDGIMERIDTGRYDEKSGGQQGVLDWVSDELTVVGIDIHEDQYRGIQCQIYARTDDGALYRQPLNSEQVLVLHRESDEIDSDDESSDDS